MTRDKDHPPQWIFIAFTITIISIFHVQLNFQSWLYSRPNFSCRGNEMKHNQKYFIFMQKTELFSYACAPKLASCSWICELNYCRIAFVKAQVFVMAKYFYMLLRKKKVQKKIVIKNTKPNFIRVHSGEFNFPFKDVSSFESTFDVGKTNFTNVFLSKDYWTVFV